MLSYFYKRKIILYEKHRGYEHIINVNKDKYKFLEISWLIKKLRYLNKFSSGNKTNLYFLNIILKIISPHYILSYNWLNKSQKLFFIYSTKNQCKFIVLQHGGYVGGLVRPDHRFLKCDVFLVWGKYFKDLFDQYNPQQRNRIKIFGNPNYNIIDRSELNYPSSIKNVLIAFTWIETSVKFKLYNEFVNKLSEKDYNFSVKYHNFQSQKFSNNKLSLIQGELSENIESFDLIITDHSTVLLDAVLFKKHVFYFQPDYLPTVYAKYLNNLASINDFSTLNFLDLIDRDKQEEIYSQMIEQKDNQLHPVIQ